MYLRIVRPLPLTLDGFDLRRFVLHGAYDVETPLAERLIVGGYAISAAPLHAPRADALAALARATVGGRVSLGEQRAVADQRPPSKRRSRSKRR